MCVINKLRKENQVPKTFLARYFSSLNFLIWKVEIKKKKYLKGYENPMSQYLREALCYF